MPALANPKHELFAQGVAKGLNAEDAYRAAGYSPHRQNAHRLMTDDDVRARVDELLARGAARAEVTVERVVRELAKIGFSDIRKVVSWTGGEVIEEQDGADGHGGEPQMIVKAANFVRLIGSGDLDDDTAAGIAEVSQTKDGSLKVKLYDKRAALVDLGRHLGMFVDRTESVVTVHDVSDRPLTVDEWAAEATTSH